MDCKCGMDEYLGTEFALDNAVVLRTIFNYLDIASLKVTRLVSKNWNDIGTTALSKSSRICLTKAEKVIELNKKIEIAPAILFRNVSISGNLFEEPILRDFVKRYGHYFETADIGSIPISDICSLLKEWCPNLKELEISVDGCTGLISSCNDVVTDSDADDGNNSIAGSPEEHSQNSELLLEPLNPDSKINQDEGITELKLVHPLNLTKLKVSWFRKVHQNPNLIHSLVTIVKTSPKLKHLDVYCSAADIKILCEEIRCQPETTRRLSSLSIGCIAENRQKRFPLKEVTELEFSSDFRFLKLVTPIEFKSQELPRLLAKVKDSIRVLVLEADGPKCHFDADWKVKGPCRMLNLPVMQKLKVLRVEYPKIQCMKSISFLKRAMPNLKTLLITHFGENGIDHLFKKHTAEPHENLKELFLDGRLQDIQTLSTIKLLFPNVTSLAVELFCNLDRLEMDQELYPQDKEWFQEALNKISLLNLKKLFLEFGPEAVLGEEHEHFPSLKGFMELEELSLSSGNYTGEISILGLSILDNLKQIPRLAVVELIDFYMEISQAIEVVKQLNARGIDVKFSCIHQEKSFWKGKVPF